MEKLDTEKLKDGKYYRGYCMNALIDGRIMEFENDKEAIRFYANYEAECYKLIVEDDEVITKRIYDPYDCFN